MKSLLMNSLTGGIILIAGCFAGCGAGTDAVKPDGVLGVMVRSQLPAAYQAAYDTVQIERDFIELIRIAGEGVETKVFLGTWCSDSRREVPRFLKVMDLAGASPAAFTLIGLDRKMKSPGGSEAPFHIERVPTFVFLKQGKEIGRIVETPHTSIEGDMVTILASGMNQ